MLIATLRVFCLLLGALAYYVAFLMYEDAQGKWQSRIEAIWISVNDREKVIGSRAVAIFNGVASVATSAFNRVFGERLLSLQLIGVSTSFSYAGVFFGLSVIFAVLFRESRLVGALSGNVIASLNFVKVGAFVIGLVFFVFAMLPTIWKSRWTVWLSLAPLIFICLGLMKLALRHRATHDQLAMLITLIASVFSDVLTLVLVRYTIRRVLTDPTPSRVCAAVSIQVFMVVLLVIAPIQLSGILMVRYGQRLILKSLFDLGLFNLFTGFASLLFLLVLFTLLLHRATWPVLGRLIYPLARYQVVRKQTLMASIGTGLLLFAFPLMPTAAKRMLEWFAK